MANCAKCGRKLSGLSFGKRICHWCVRHEAAQRGEEPEDATQPVMPTPWTRADSSRMGLTHVLVGINLAVFLGMALAGISIMDPPSQDLIRWGANSGRLTMTGQWWRLISYMFLHGGIIHIGFNMWCLWDLGALAESLYGRWSFGAIYLISGVAGGVLSMAWDPGRVTVGASGAIFGLAGALIASFYIGEFSMPRAFMQSRLRSLVVFAGYNLLFGAVSGRTDNAAHIGGFAAGLVLGVLIARVAPEGDNFLARTAVVFAVALGVFGGAAWLQHSRGYLLHAETANGLFAENKMDEAIAELQASVRQRPNYVPAHYALAFAYASKQQFGQAEAELRRVLELEPENHAAQYSLGFVYLDEKRIPEAKAAFTALLAKNPNSARAHFGIGATLAAEENYREALQEYRTAATLNPKIEGVYYNIGLSAAKLKMYDDALAAHLTARDAGDTYENELALADVFLAKGMQHQAEDARKKASQLKSEQ